MKSVSPVTITQLMNLNYNNINSDMPAPGEMHATAEFLDVGAVNTQGVSTDNSLINVNTGFSLLKFLERPVKIYSLASDAAATDFYPWNLFLSNTAVGKKLSNYKGIRGTLHLRFQQASMPFIYGKHAWTYKPLNEDGLSSRVSDLILSKFPKVFLDPSINEPAELIIPHLWRYPFIDLRENSSTLNGMDQIICRRFLVADYQRADSASTPSIVTDVYAWLTDVELFGAISDDYISQSGEYKGVVSQPATVVADVAGKLVDIPGIGIFARATEIGARALAKIASLFGYSKPININPPMAMYENGNRNMYCSEGLDIANKLTVDIKQENTFGSSFISGTDTDPLSFKTILTRPSFIRSSAVGNAIVWATTDAVGTVLLSLPVTPGLFNSGGTNILGLPSIADGCVFFKFWRGSIIFRLHICSSQYHRGRLRVLWTPNPLSSPTTSEMTNVAELCIIDINNDQVVDLEINWGSMEPFKQFHLMSSGLSADINQYPFCNGYIYLQVQQALTAPLSTASLNMGLEIFAGDDFAVAVPTQQIVSMLHTQQYDASAIEFIAVGYPTQSYSTGAQNVSSFYPSGTTFDPVIQSGLYNSPKAKPILKCTVNKPLSTSKEMLLMHIGEAFDSFRPLLKSYMHYHTINMTGTAVTVGSTNYSSYFLLPFIPLRTSYDTIGGTLYQNSRYASIFNWIHMLFAARRGGIRYKCVVKAEQTTQNSHTIEAIRVRYADNTAVGAFPGLPDQLNWQVSNMVTQGTIIYDRSEKTSLTVEIPYQLPDSFLKNQVRLENNGVPYLPYYDGALVVISNVPASKDVNVEIYGSYAEDATFDFFWGTPLLYCWYPEWFNTD